jgi:hypothetical protein
MELSQDRLRDGVAAAAADDDGDGDDTQESATVHVVSDIKSSHFRPLC